MCWPSSSLPVVIYSSEWALANGATYEFLLESSRMCCIWVLLLPMLIYLRKELV
jgi:hypothetical protein